jgi:mRNA interferase MazF
MSRTIFERGDIVLVPFSFTNQTASKQRPAVVVSNPALNARRPDLILMAVTG